MDAIIPLENHLDRVDYEGEITENEDSIYLFLKLSKGKGRIGIADIDSLEFKTVITMRVVLLETSIPLNIKTREASEQLEWDIEEYFKKEYENLFAKL